MDAVAPAILVAQAIGRIGNYFNQELFGGPTSLPWGLEIPYQYRVSGGIPAADLHFATFQPTFLYELIFDFAWAGVLIWLGHRYEVEKPPGLFALYVFGYSPYRIFEESLRIDSLGPHLRAAAEHVHRLGADRGRRRLVLPHPAPPARALAAVGPADRAPAGRLRRRGLAPSGAAPSGTTPGPTRHDPGPTGTTPASPGTAAPDGPPTPASAPAGAGPAPGDHARDPGEATPGPSPT